MQGKIIDAETKKTVLAQVKYESLPYGSKLGVFSGETFSFNMEDGNEYALIVRADGYNTHTARIKPAEAANGQIEKVIELKSDGVNEIIKLDKLIFELGLSEISEGSYEQLDKLANMIKTSETMVVQLEGHTDFRGNAKQNMKLSEDRVREIRKYLVSQGIDRKRIKTKAFGGTKPISRDKLEAVRAVNRRVEVRLLIN